MAKILKDEYSPLKAQEGELDELEEKLKKEGFFEKNKHFIKNDNSLISALLSGNYKGISNIKKIKFENCYFTDLYIEGKTFSIPFEFINCNFSGVTTFYNCIFNCDFSFNASIFSSDTTFKECDFLQRGIFDNIKTATQTNLQHRGWFYKGFTISGTQKEYNTQSFLSFRNAEIKCPFLIERFNKLNLDFTGTKFFTKFYFDLIFGFNTLFYETSFFEDKSVNLSIGGQISSLRTLVTSLSESKMNVEAKIVDDMLNDIYSHKEGKSLTNAPKDKDGKTIGEPLNSFVKEEEMCNIVGIGYWAFQKRKQEARTDKNIYVPRPYNLGHRPFLYTQETVEEFKRIYEQECNNNQ